MMELLFNDNAAWFAVPALVGTILFLIRLAMLLVGGGHDLHVGDVQVGGAGDHHGDPGEAFKALSLQSIVAFLMGFGWAGFGAYRGSHLAMMPSIAIGIAGGVAMVWLLGIMLKGMYDLQSSGNIDIHAAVGQEGDVYLTVPSRGEGRGQVRVTLQARQRIWNAITEGEALPTSTRVKVTRVNDDNTLTVSQA